MVLQAPSAVTITVIAKDYGKSGTWLNEKLYELGIQYKIGRTWVLYQKYAGLGYTDTASHIYDRLDGTPDCRIYTKWTQKGRMFIYEKLKEIGILPLVERKTRKIVNFNNY